MPVASYVQGTHIIGPRAIMAPKEASQRGWWNEIRKVFRELELPPLGQVPKPVAWTVTEDVIHFSWGVHDVFIARKRNMR